MVFVGARVVRRLNARVKGFRGISEGLKVIGGGIVFPGISKVFAGEEGGSFGRFWRSSMVHGCLILQLDRQ